MGRKRGGEEIKCTLLETFLTNYLGSWRCGLRAGCLASIRDALDLMPSAMNKQIIALEILQHIWKSPPGGMEFNKYWDPDVILENKKNLAHYAWQVPRGVEH